jgi:Spy/CpxP family protein refolding chaperone
MARHSRGVLAALIMAAAALVTAEARSLQSESPKSAKSSDSQGREGRRDQNHDCRPWWKDAKCVAEIGITPEQSATIDSIFRTEIEKMKPLRESINQLERSLNETVRANTTDVAVFTRQVQKIEKMRAELNTMRTVMLYRMRRVLNSEQNAKIQAVFDRREADRRKQDSDRHH